MDWDDLRFVLALSRAGTLTAAAGLLQTTHTTVARRIRALEETLGVRLFDGDEHGYLPTSAGAHVVESAERTETEMLELETRLLGGDKKLEGKLRVTASDILFRRYRDVFVSFIERFPGIELTLSCNDAEASLKRREADIALRMTKKPSPELFGRKVGQVEFAVYASRELVRRLGKKRSLAAYPWLNWDERLGLDWLDHWLAAHAPGARAALRIDMGSLALREVVASGIGVHFLSTDEGDGDPRLVRVGAVATDYSREVWLLTLSELRTTARVRAFIDHCVAHPLSAREKRGSSQ